MTRTTESPVYPRRFTAPRHALIANNLFGSAPLGLATADYAARGNQSYPDHGMIDPREYDFRLTRSARAIDSGIPLEDESKEDRLAPAAEYVYPVSMRSRASVAKLDVARTNSAPSKANRLRLKQIVPRPHSAGRSPAPEQQYKSPGRGVLGRRSYAAL